MHKTTFDFGDMVVWLRRRRWRGNNDGPRVGCGRSQEKVNSGVGPWRVGVEFGMHGKRLTVDVLVWRWVCWQVGRPANSLGDPDVVHLPFHIYILIECVEQGARGWL